MKTNEIKTAVKEPSAAVAVDVCPPCSLPCPKCGSTDINRRYRKAGDRGDYNHDMPDRLDTRGINYPNYPIREATTMKEKPNMTKAQRYLIKLATSELEDCTGLSTEFSFISLQSGVSLPDSEILVTQWQEMRQTIADYRAAVETAIERLKAAV